MPRSLAAAPPTTGASSTMSSSVTSATITVMLSGPPPRSASWISRSAHWFGSAYSRMVARDGLVRHHAGQAVAADQVAVAGDGLAHRVLGVGVAAVERAHEQRLLRVGVRLLRRDPALVDEQLHVGVVPGDLGELARRAAGRPASRRCGPCRILLPPKSMPGQRRAHALHRRVRVDRVADLLVGGVDRVAQRVDRGVAGHVLVEVAPARR